MKKSIVLVALATLMLGLTSCEENENDNAFQETYTLHFNSTANGDDLSAVTEGYLKAAGIAADAEEESVLVNGKDSADCAAQFLSLMAKAEKVLAAQTHWDEVVVVVAYDTKHTLVYGKQWGAEGDNYNPGYGNPNASSSYHSYPLSNIKGVTSEPQRGKYIKDYYVDTFNSSLGVNVLGNNVWTSSDLNSQAGGRYIYLSAEPTDNIEEAITGAFVLKSDVAGMPTTITYKGVKYTCCGERDGAPLPNYRNRDLNEGAGGKYLFLYTTHDKSLKRALVWGCYTCYYDSFGLFGWGGKKSELSSHIGAINIVGDEVEFMPGTTLVKSTDDLKDLKLQYRDVDYNMDLGQDMNEGSGGLYMYILQQWENR